MSEEVDVSWAEPEEKYLDDPIVKTRTPYPDWYLEELKAEVLMVENAWVEMDKVLESE